MEPLIKIVNLSKTFNYDSSINRLKVIENLTLSVYERECLAVVGPSGCGKTTLLNIISGILSPSSGEIFFNGNKIKGITKGIGYIFQRDALFPWKTVYENVAFSLKLQKQNRSLVEEKVERWLKKVGLSNFRNYYPSQLSQGMRKRVSIAMTMINEPKLILLDEAFSSLDAQTRQILENEVLKIWKETLSTLIFVTHDLIEAIAVADRILILTDIPARKKVEINVDLPRPRDVREVFNNPKFFQIYVEAWKFLKEEVEKRFE